MNALEFAKTHDTDSDWVQIMTDLGKNPVVLHAGQHGTYSGFDATVVRHYCNGMYEIRVPGGVTCVDGSHFIPTK